MIANFDVCDWGRGGRLFSAPDTGRGGLDEQQVADLQGQSAKEAIDSLEGDFAVGNLPDVSAVTFPGPVSESYYWSDADVVGICGPVGSGKTTTKNKRKLRRAIEMPASVIDGVRRYKVVFIRETYRQLWSTTIPSYLETFPKELGKWSGGRGDPVTHVIHFEDEYGPIEFVAEFMAFGDDPVASMRGMQATDIDLNEADTMVVEILTVGIGRIDRWPAREHFAGLPDSLRSYGCIDCDFNAPNEDNWTFGVFYDEEIRTNTAAALSSELPEGAKPIEIAFFNQPGYGEKGCENLQNLGPSYYQRQIAAMTLAGRGDMVARLIHNKVIYLRAGDPVFSREFNRRIHVSDVPLKADPRVPLRLGFDQGFIPAAIISQLMPNLRWRILGELHFPNERLFSAIFGARLRKYLDDRFPGHRVEAGWGDMAGEQGASQSADENATWNREVAAAVGIIIRPQRTGNNWISPRLEAVRAALEAPLEAGEPGLLIDPSCRFLIRGFEARYVWTDEVNASGDKRKVPDKSKTEANVHDALQYLLLSEHLGDGTSPYAARAKKRLPDKINGLMGHNGGPSLSGNTGGLQSGWDISDPYGA